MTHDDHPAEDHMHSTPRRPRRQPYPPTTVHPVTAGPSTALAVLGVTWRQARELARAHGVRCVLSGDRIVAVDVADWVHVLARPIAAAPLDTAEVAEDPKPQTAQPETADDVLARIGRRRIA